MVDMKSAELDVDTQISRLSVGLAAGTSKWSLTGMSSHVVKKLVGTRKELVTLPVVLAKVYTSLNTIIAAKDIHLELVAT